MSYLLMEENLFHSLMGRILNQATDVNYRFSETDYWMNGKKVCEFLNISQGLLSAFCKNNMLFYCRIINSEQEALKGFEEQITDLQVKNSEKNNRITYILLN